MNKTLGYLIEELFSINNRNNSAYFNCESANFASQLLKDVNIIIVDSLKRPNSLSIDLPIDPSPNNSTDVDPGPRTDYEYNEAIVYMVFILVWYSLFVVLLICTQTKKSELQYLEDSQNATKYLVRGTKGEHVKREVLGKQKCFTILFSPSNLSIQSNLWFKNKKKKKNC